MTAEIVVMNKKAAALAADSAITYNQPGGKKHFQSANKIFTLSKYHPVGVMVFANSQFMSSPWETVIKDYRDRIRDDRFAHLSDYADDFLDFLHSTRMYSPNNVQESFYRQVLEDVFEEIRKKITEEWNAVIDAKGAISTPEYKRIAKKVIERYKDHLRTPSHEHPTLPDDFDEALREEYEDLIADVKRTVFEKLLTSTTSRWLTEIAISIGVQSPFGGSGLVVVGFGTDDRFPKQQAYYIGGVLADHLVYREQDAKSVEYGQNAVISAYAQHEMVNTFLDGIDPRFRGFIVNSISDIIQELPADIIGSIDDLDNDERRELKERFEEVGQQLINEYKQDLARYSADLHSSPIVSVVSALPKDELAQLAESLVYLTVLKRRVSMQEESVDEPIDVAVISKGDGFVWVNRKHYFPAKLNPQFAQKYFRHTQRRRREGNDE